MYVTQIDLPQAVRDGAIARLQMRLCDVLDLEAQARQAHWNVRGRNFYPMHQLFERIAGELGEAADEIAERIATLGGTADGRITTVAADSSLPNYPLHSTTCGVHLEALAGALAQFGKAVRADVDAAASAGDAGTAELVAGVLRKAEKQLWLVEAHLGAH